MNEYLLSLIGIILLSAILTSILPDGKTLGLIKSIMRMVCILAIISPIFTYFQSGEVALRGGGNYDKKFAEAGIEIDSIFIHYYSEMRISETEKALKQELFEIFSVDCEVLLEWVLAAESVGRNESIEVVKITNISINMQETPTEEVKKKMWEYLTKNYCSEVLIE